MKPHTAGLLLLFLLWLSNAFAQSNREVDSLLAALSQTETDSARCRLELEISRKIRPIDPIQSIEHAERALELAERNKDYAKIADAHLNIGMAMDLQGEYLDEQKHYMEALGLYESLHDSVGLADTYNAIGTLFYNMDNYEKALEYHQEAYGIRKRLGRKKFIASSLNNVGISYMEMDSLDSARMYFDRALLLNRETGNRAWEAVNLQNIGQCLMKREQYDSALIFLHQALTIRKSLQLTTGIISSLLGIGEVYYRQEKYKESLVYQQEAYDLAVELHSPKLIRRSLRGLGFNHHFLGEYKEASAFFHDYILADDSLEGGYLTGSITSSLFEREKENIQRMEQAAAENQRLQQEARLARQRFWIWISLAGLGIALLLAGLLFQTSRNRRRMNELLERKVKERTEKLGRANAELDKFIYQSSHDLRSPITSIRGLADLALSPAGKDDPARYLALIKDRAEHMDGVYSNLIITMNIRDRVLKLQAVSLSQLLEEMVEEVRKARAGQLLQLDTQLEVQGLQADPLLLLQALRSIAINAIDFAQKGQQPRLTVTSRRKGNVIEIELRDAGIGIAAEALPHVFDMFYRGSNQSKGSGLGLYNAKLACEKMGFEIQVQSESGQGTAFTLFCPDLSSATQ
jgi:signal transduction histidine kinase/Tfp pilus assembly protein PilF